MLISEKAWLFLYTEHKYGEIRVFSGDFKLKFYQFEIKARDSNHKPIKLLQAYLFEDQNWKWFELSIHFGWKWFRSVQYNSCKIKNFNGLNQRGRPKTEHGRLIYHSSNNLVGMKRTKKVLNWNAIFFFNRFFTETTKPTS